MYFGMSWMDPANWNGVPIDGQSGQVMFKARSNWKIAEFLPPAVRSSLVLYAAELLVEPQRELHNRMSPQENAPAQEMDVDKDEQDFDEPQPACGEVEAAVAPVEAKPDVPA